MPTITKRENEEWPQAVRGLEIQLLPGTHQPAKFSAATDMTIRGGEGVRIERGMKPSGDEPPCSLRFMDGCHRLQIIGPLEVCYSDGRGIRITRADDIVLRDLYIHHCGIEGIITGDCRNGLYENIRVEDSRRVANGYSDDKRHGIYISGNADGSDVLGLKIARVTGSGLQINGAGMNAVAEGIAAERLEFYHCGSGGTPPISLMAVRNSVISRFFIDWTAGDKWAVLFADGQGPEFACVGNTLNTYTVPRGKICSEEEGSHDNSWDPAGGWSPDDAQPPEPEPPEPEPEPEPEPPSQDMQQAIEDMSAALTAIAAANSDDWHSRAIGQALEDANDALARIQAAAGAG